MSKKPEANNVEDFAKKSVDQAQQAFDKATDYAHENAQVFDAAANAFKSGMTELQMKAMEFTQANVQAAFSFTRAMTNMKHPNEIAEANQSYLNDTLQTAVTQAKEINDLAVALAEDTSKPLQGGVVKSFEEMKKAFTN